MEAEKTSISIQDDKNNNNEPKTWPIKPKTETNPEVVILKSLKSLRIARSQESTSQNLTTSWRMRSFKDQATNSNSWQAVKQIDEIPRSKEYSHPSTMKSMDQISNFSKQSQSEYVFRGWKPQDRNPYPHEKNIDGLSSKFMGGFQQETCISYKPQYNLKYKLNDLINQRSCSEVVTELSNPINHLDMLLHCRLECHIFSMLLSVLKKVCSAEWDDNMTYILSQACTPKFLEQFSPNILACERMSSERLSQLLEDMLIFFKTVGSVLPISSREDVNLHLKGCQIVTQRLQQKCSMIPKDGIFDRFQSIVVSFDSLQTNNFAETGVHTNDVFKPVDVKTSSQNMAHSSNDFRALSVYPTAEDVLSQKKPFIRPNIVLGGYANVEHYLDVQFRLLREDLIGPFREGIETYKSSDKKKIQASLRVYKNVTFLPKECYDQMFEDPEPNQSDDESLILIKKKPLKEGIAVKFQVAKKIDWDETKRLMFQSLVCFTRDNFKTIFFATVSTRHKEDLRKGVIFVELTSNSEENIFQYKYLMAECPVFFEPYLHIMKSLQALDTDSFPMAKYLVHMDMGNPPPEYLKNTNTQRYDTCYKFNTEGRPCFVPVLDLKAWPNSVCLGLDPSQHRALQHALTKELVVLQGPPGTGKTFMGLKIAQILVENKQKSNRTGPILIVSLTNHALDQFLVGMLEHTTNLARVGGRSKDKKLEDFNVRNWKKFPRGDRSTVISYSDYIEQTLHQVAYCKDQIKTAETSTMQGILSISVFQEYGIVQQKEADELQGASFLNWLTEDDSGSRAITASTFSGCVGFLNFDLKLDNIRKEIEENEETIEEEEYNDENLAKYIESLKESENQLVFQLSKPQNPSPEDVSKLLKQESLWKLRSSQRWSLYWFWVNELITKLNLKLKTYQEFVCHLKKKLKATKLDMDMEILREREIVGMTTTGAARLSSVLHKLEAQIVILEEAAEVLEPHVVACLTQHCKHLILIGDHKQLRPTTAVHELAIKYCFDVSLFERFVRNRGQCQTLEVQHRMAPEIAKLIVPNIYEKLENHESVCNFEPIRGIHKRLFFVTHSWEEFQNLDTSSHENAFEAQFLIGLSRYLILQGYSSSQITILTTYSAQMQYINKEIQQYSILQGMLAVVVDNYQGEENDIILLSLVRSNKERNIGFLATENRVCVALSRARKGFYIVGNMDCLAEASIVWKKVRLTLENQGALGTSLPLRCQIHPGEKCEVASDRDFYKFAPEGGCTRMCIETLPCSHPCDRACHPQIKDHARIICSFKCERLCNAKLHECKKLCSDDCGSCGVMVLKELPCGHKTSIPCHKEVDTFSCDYLVENQMKNCGHKVLIKCCEDTENLNCSLPCGILLKCGHECEALCHVGNDTNHTINNCLKPCLRYNADCTENHACNLQCHVECKKCPVLISKKRSCGHEIQTECSADPEQQICRGKCQRKLGCGHSCMLLCWQKCTSHPCNVSVLKELSICGHKALIKCNIKPEQSVCQEMCGQILWCGHRCQEKCGLPCTLKCMVPVGMAEGMCGHQVPIFCYEEYEGVTKVMDPSRCHEPCNCVLECHHVCFGTCGSCMQGRFHLPCLQPCGKVLVCGHRCTDICAAPCTPCKLPCSFRCAHTICTKLCGEPCDPCKEKCSWQCQHLQCTKLCSEICDRPVCSEPCHKLLICGHLCIGLCGEMCPQFCWMCHKHMLTSLSQSFITKPGTRFIVLPSCSHIFEAQILQIWLNQNCHEVGLKTCPHCSVPIFGVFMFNMIVRQAYQDVTRVRTKMLLVNSNAIENKRNKLCTKLMAIEKSLKCSEDHKELKWSIDKIHNSLKNKVGSKRNVLYATDIRHHQIQVNLLTNLTTNWVNCQASSEVKDELKTAINTLLAIMNKKPLGQQQVDDLSLEALRLARVSQLMDLKKHAQNLPAETKSFVQQFESIALGTFTRYSLVMEAKAEILHHDIKAKVMEVCGISLPEYPHKKIPNILLMCKGCWLKCPNGHVINMNINDNPNCGECGAPAIK